MVTTFPPRGRDLLRDPRYNPGTAFTAVERSGIRSSYNGVAHADLTDPVHAVPEETWQATYPRLEVK